MNERKKGFENRNLQTNIKERTVTSKREPPPEVAVSLRKMVMFVTWSSPKTSVSINSDSEGKSLGLVAEMCTFPSLVLANSVSSKTVIFPDTRE